MLSQLGIKNQQHQQTIMQGIEQLKKDHMKGLLDRFDGDDYATLFRAMEDHLKNGTPSYITIHQHVRPWLKELPSHMTIHGMEFLCRPQDYPAFLKEILNAEYQSIPKHELEIIDSSPLSKDDQWKMVERLRNYKRETRHRRHDKVCIVRGWYPCSHQEMLHIATQGFTQLIRLGPEPNDQGFCFKSSAKAAAEQLDRDGCLLMCYILLQKPIVTVMKNSSNRGSEKCYRYYSDGRHSSDQWEHPSVRNSTSTRVVPSSHEVRNGYYDEFVTFKAHQIYSQVIVYLGQK